MWGLLKPSRSAPTLILLGCGAVLGQLSLWVGAVFMAAGLVWLSLSARPVASRLPRVRVEWPARRGNTVKHLKRRRKHLRRALSDPAANDWQDDAFRHAVEVHEDLIAADLARYAPQYAGRWIGQARYSIASPPESQREFFVMRLTQAVALLDDVIAQMECHHDRDAGA